ncbi:hypothetical protein O0I10_005978 [Lichtheimia ornata]|uniref:DUF221-domain-containing protein n=1 Tax=Lichtheimia ornata TaxID=688661 RepID=A0AAD7XXM4_9FUNG|nr:uncharacterized protein O0I10_005978 [Lichtheimia ornata]KAJ8658295.1 hypothetical protein O0I10_005978 [Lichtheimia ornata]
MSDSPSDQLDADSSVSTFTSALWFNAALAGGFFGTFLIVRRHRPQVYRPRTYLVDEKRQPPLSDNGALSWIYTMLRMTDTEVLQSIGLDRFMVLRFLRMGIVVFGLFTFLAVPILIPLNVINQLDTKGLNLLTIGNVKDLNRLWAHLILAVILSAGIIYYTFRETRVFLVLRRRFLLSPDYAKSVTARTLYVPSIPEGSNNIDELTKIFNRFPGGVRRIWIARDTKDLPDIVAEREKHVKGLEGAVTNAIAASYKHHAKNKGGDQIESGGSWVIPDKLRPRHRVSPLPISVPCVGRKVDSLEYYHKEISDLNGKILAAQRSPEAYPQLSSAFIEFNQQIAAHMAAQCVIHSHELQMAPRFLQIAPSDIIWDNMNIKSLERLIRRFISLTLTSAIVIFWIIPVGFVQAVANIQSLTEVLPFLAVLNSLPPTAVGIIQGILPAVALAILVALVPIIFKIFSTQEGIPQKSMVDLALLDKYFFFLYVDVMLISTIVGGVVQAIGAIAKNPLSIINTLAESLPKASTFFITYVMLQALNSSGQAMLQTVPLVLSYVFPFLSKTPRDIYTQRTKCPTTSLGTLVPSHTIIFVLGIEYSTIAPLILPFVALFFMLTYFVYLYQFLFVYELEYETGGLAFPRALRHVYIGLFTWQLTMIGLFAIKQAIPQLVIMVVVLVVSVFALMLYDLSFNPLFEFLPIQENEHEIKATVTSSSGGSTNSNVLPAALEDKKLMSKHDQNGDGKVQHINHLQDEGQKQDDHGVIVDQDGLPVDAYMASDQLRKRVKSSEHERSGSSSDPDFAMSTARLVYGIETYMNPALYQAQPTVWLPEDDLGITHQQMDELRKSNITTSAEGARAEHAGKHGQKSKIVVDEALFENGGQGIPGEAPTPNQFSRVNENVQNAVHSANIVDSFAMTS